jgi:AcrR family transcriptional regulator
VPRGITTERQKRHITIPFRSVQGTELDTESKVPRIDARRNREAVIDAALELLAEQPTASMATIAEHSGVGRTTVYRHFPHREDLIKALFERVVEDARRVTTDVIEGGDTARDVLYDLGPAIIGIGRRYMFLEAQRQHGEEVLTESTLDQDDPVRHFITRAKKNGDVRADVPVQWVLSQMSAMANGAMVELGSGRVDAEEAGRLLGNALVDCFAA